MDNFDHRQSSYILGVGFFLIIIWSLHHFVPAFTQSNYLVAIVTLLVGGVAIYLYLKQRKDQKRDAARIILQEVRRAEDIISDYKKTGGYQFAKSIIATNSWSKNIHHFVGDLSNDELDNISDLYSTGEYLDKLIGKISSITLNHDMDEAKSIRKKQQRAQQEGQGAFVSSAPRIDFSSIWNKRLNLISNQVEAVYYTAIVEKLRKIAQL